MVKDDLKLRLHALLRRFGLVKVPRPVLVFSAFLIFAFVLGAIVYFWPTKSIDSSQDFQVHSAEAGTQETVIKVDVEGCVLCPGLYEFTSDARVGDAVNKAGGLTKSAAQGTINLAQKLEDGAQIYIPSKTELSKKNASLNTSENSSAVANAGSSEKININSASAQELQKLSGIGETLAQRIIDYREKNGSFTSIEDLKKVSGIGDARYESLKENICI